MYNPFTFCGTSAQHVHPHILLPFFHPLLQPTGALTQGKNTIWDAHLVEPLWFNLTDVKPKSSSSNSCSQELQGWSNLLHWQHCFTEILNRKGRECHSRMAFRHVQCATTVFCQPKDSYKMCGIGLSGDKRHDGSIFAKSACHQKEALWVTQPVWIMCCVLNLGPETPTSLLYSFLFDHDEIYIFFFCPISKHIYMCVCVIWRSKLKHLENPVLA